VARAKRTARADARRRHRADQGLAPELATDELSADDSPRGETAAATAVPQPGAAGGRLSIGDAFRRSFTPLDIRGDLRALPWIATRTKALWVPAAITIASTIAFYITQGADIITRFAFAYFIQTPAIGGVFLAGFLAPRASWLLGIIVGLLSAACYAFLILTLFSAVAEAAPTTGFAQEIILSAFVLSPALGMVFAAAAAWYRRFLALSNPNRGRRQTAKVQGRPDGKTRGSQKASARR
jgi:hypothetical protein